MNPPAGVVDGLLAGRYRLSARLGSGANGEVWRAHDERLDRDVAVKVLRPELADDEDVRARFRAEARHAGGLHHPGIAAVFDFADGDEGAWLVMELVDGEPLSDVLRAQGRLPVDRTLDVVEQAAAALQAAHDGGVVHRDVKPGNLLLRRDGRLSVTDFGIAHAAGAAALTRTGQIVGTAAYLAPEQASGGPVSAATDLYALGVVAHECLSGARPFERDDPVAVLLAHLQAPPPPLPVDVPGPVGDLVRRLLAKDPAERPDSAAQVQQEAARLRHSLAAVRRTAVLPAASVPVAPVPAVSRVAPSRGLADRPGQRRAVRATALVLGLLAVALGVRDATQDEPVSDLQERPPTSSAPPVPVATDGGTVVQPSEEEPAQQPVPVPVHEPAREPVQDGGQDEQQGDAEQLEEQRELEEQKRKDEQKGRDGKEQGGNEEQGGKGKQKGSGGGG